MNWEYYEDWALVRGRLHRLGVHDGLGAPAEYLGPHMYMGYYVTWEFATTWQSTCYGGGLHGVHKVEAFD